MTLKNIKPSDIVTKQNFILPVYVTFQKFIVAYRGFIIFSRQFEKDWINERIDWIFKIAEAKATEKEYHERKKYCNDFISKNKKRDDAFDKIIFSIGEREYDIDGITAIEIRTKEELFTLFCGNVQYEIDNG